jgi:hypothetical protein
MADDEYLALARQSEELAGHAPDRQIASSWRSIAAGFRQLARLHASGLRYWQARAKERERQREAQD